jgi:ABC-type transport system substrate-binding protein
MFRASNLAVFFLSIFCFNVMAGERARVVQGIRVPVASLDPFATTGIDAFSAISNVIEPLFRIHPSTGELMPCLGLSYKLDPKKKTIRVKLRPHVHFQNGDSLTSEDVQFTFEAYHKPE